MKRPVLLIAGIALLSGHLAMAQAEDWSAVAFMYHRFGEDNYPSTSVRMEQFEAHLDHIDEAGYTVWPIERIVDHVQSGEPIPDRTVAITIDDAYRSVYENAYPLLRERDLPFSVFVATDPIDEGRRGYMTWDQMREMREHGATFANHTASHDYLIRRESDESDSDYEERIRADLRKAEERLREELGEDQVPDLFAYPYGEYSDMVASIAESMGYVSLGQHSGAIGPHSDTRALPRFPMAENYADIDAFAEKAGARSLPVTKIEPWNPRLDDGRPPRLVVHVDTGSDVALDQLRCFIGGQGPSDIEWLDRDSGIFAVQAEADLPVGRTRYNCTAPSPDRGRYYWFSQQWVRPPAAE